MGGLDCRYMISHIKPSEYTVASLTTIATPHRGSSFMDWCRDALGVGRIHSYMDRHGDDHVAASLPVAKKIPLLRAICAPLDAPAFTNLTRAYCEAFNQHTPDDPNVFYSSYAAATEVSVFAPLHFSYNVIRRIEGANDGLVALESAKWGEFMGSVDCDHWDLIPPKVRGLASGITGRKFDSVGFYLRVVTELADRGF
nr:hypothetical protein HK105_002328 [Polyrhizophydium stewartii]